MQKFEVAGHEPSFLPDGKKFKLIWADEFDGKELDRTKWDFRLNFWGKPFKAYTDEGIILDGKSNVEIHIIKKGEDYCSAQLQTGSNSFDIPSEEPANPWGQSSFWPLGDIKKPKFMHKYGYYECRCKLQKNKGWWSAFWLQSPNPGSTYDPAASGVECDIMEYFSSSGHVTSGNIYGGYGRGFRETGRVRYYIENEGFERDGKKEKSRAWFTQKSIAEDFHRFGVLWNKDGYVFYWNGEEVSRSSAPVSHVEQFILLTTECMGYRHADGKPAEELKTAVLPDCFTVDYVRVFDEE